MLFKIGVDATLTWSEIDDAIGVRKSLRIYRVCLLRNIILFPTSLTKYSFFFLCSSVGVAD
jgi:hypothetical protein